MRISPPFLTNPDVMRLLALFEREEVYFVGGCVRNTLLGVPVSDIDLATAVLPRDVIARAERAGIKAVPTGIEHGTVTLVVSQHPFEVTTFRRDVKTDGRRAVVAFSDRLEDDARRRDFTMNALYLRPTGEIVDPVGGISDLEARRFRFIGDADMRIKEDALRILRLFRFQAWYGTGDFDPDALNATERRVSLLDTLSRERIGTEFLKLLSAPDPVASVMALAEIAALRRIVPGGTVSNFASGLSTEPFENPHPLYRLALFDGHDEIDALRLSRADALLLRKAKEAAASEGRAAEIGYKFGLEVGLIGMALRVAASHAVEPDWARRVRAGSEVRFPIEAKDLADQFEGKTLGDVLRRLEQEWISSGFALSRSDLLALVGGREV